jgi:membrane-associated phospholipid phosphatase
VPFAPLQTRRIVAAYTTSLLVALPTVASPQAVLDRFVNDIRDYGKDIVLVWFTPFQGSARDWALAGGIVAGGAALSPLDDDIDRWGERNANASQWEFLRELRRGGAVYGGNKIAPYAGAAYVYALVFDNRDIRDGLFGCIASYASESVSRNYFMYPLIARTRPDTVRHRDDSSPLSPTSRQGDQYKFDFPGSKAWGEHSLPGGHVANVAACASFLTSRFRMGLVEPLLHGVVAGVGIGRILDRGHWASDQVLGVAFGYAVGREMARRSIKRARGASGGTSDAGNGAGGLSIGPTLGGVQVSWSRVF